MKIRAARVIVTCPSRNFVTLKIETECGLYGVGDATLNGRELAVASYLQDHLIPCLIGRDASQIEDIWQYFYKGAYWRRGPVTMTAIAAIDVALWDIKAKAANMPLYQLLGGKSRHGVLVYSHANGRDLAETVDEVGRYIELGYKAIRAQSGIPGLDGTYGVSKIKGFYEPADADLPSESIWSTVSTLISSLLGLKNYVSNTVMSPICYTMCTTGLPQLKQQDWAKT
jgi:mannonate dehydratase